MRRKGSHGHGDHPAEDGQHSGVHGDGATATATIPAQDDSQDDPNSVAATSDPDSLRQQIKEKDEEIRRRQDQYLRALADMENVRKRVRQEKDEAVEYANADLVKQLLPILDNFELAVRHSETSRDFDALLQGVTQILKQTRETLKKFGVEPIEAVGKPFNPEEHEAIGHTSSEEYEEGVIAEDVRTGYRLRGRCLRPSLVRVAG